MIAAPHTHEVVVERNNANGGPASIGLPVIGWIEPDEESGIGVAVVAVPDGRCCRADRLAAEFGLTVLGFRATIAVRREQTEAPITDTAGIAAAMRAARR